MIKTALSHRLSFSFQMHQTNDEIYKKKKSTLKKFVSQQHAPYFKEECIDSFHHNFLCSKKGLDKVESYRIVESFSK